MRFLDGAYDYFKKQPVYCLLMFLGTLMALGCIGFLRVATAYLVGLLEGEVVGWAAWVLTPLAIVLAWGGWGLSFLLGLVVFGVTIHYARRFRFRYSETADAISEEPTLRDYDISEQEFTSYMNRFQVSHLLVALGTIVTMFSVASLGTRPQEKFLAVLMFLSVVILVPLAIHIAILMVNAALDRRYPQYRKVERYLEAKRIYEKVLEEL